jgi:diguanylate cyclase (GGDEF)-like protein
MKKIWEFYENMNEIVYASDIDTYEIVYMNRKTRELYGVNSVQETKGKKCYEVFHGCASPCAICTNKNLKTNQFEEWSYYNPVLQKTFLLKDTMVLDKGRRLRVQLALDVTRVEQQKAAIREYIDNETMVNEGLRLALMTDYPDEAINIFLEYIGKSLKSDRVYIFEGTEGGAFSNTYEWCANDVTMQKGNLQNIPPEALKCWMHRFKDNQNVIIKNLEQIRQSDPVSYGYLSPQEIHCLVASPLMENNRIIGFYGVDNPPEKTVDNVINLFPIIGHFIVSMLKRRELVRRLENLSYYDQLTGCQNRHALSACMEKLSPDHSIGIVNGDVNGLKCVNDTMGHQAGDQLLIRASDSLKRVFEDYPKFRIGGDEFLVVCEGITQEELEQRVQLLRADQQEHGVQMSLGCVWHPNCLDNLDHLLTEADARMYEDKRQHYAEVCCLKNDKETL